MTHLIRDLGRIAMIAALVAGCGGKSSDGGDASSCKTSLDQGMTSMAETQKKMLDARIGSADAMRVRAERVLDRRKKMFDTLGETLTARCTEDKWSGDVMDCMSKVTRREEVQSCLAKLPSDQKDKANAAVTSALQSNINGLGSRIRNTANGTPHGLAPLGTQPPSPIVPAPAPVAPTPDPAPAATP